MDRFVEIDRKKIFYTDKGSGEVIVFLHGWMASKTVYEDITDILSKKYRCISIDIPGFGKSDLVGRMTIKKIPSLIHKVLKRLKAKSFFLVGNSFGGALSIIYTNKYKDEVRKVVLISPFINFKQFSKLTYFSVRYIIPYVIGKKILLPIFNIVRSFMNINYKEIKGKNLHEISSKERIKAKAINAFRIAYELSSLDLYSELRKMRKDTLFIYGDKDGLLSIKPLESIFGIITNIHLAIFEDVRHYIYTFDSTKLAKKIDLFFNGNRVQ